MKVHHVSPDAAVDAGSEYFVGKVSVQPIVSPDQGIDITVVRFSPGARTYLHTHDVPQVLHCIEGTGILATETERNVVKPGDIVHVPAGELHWHGATEDSAFVHLSIRPPGQSQWTGRDPLAEG
jgi:quercetin dioxygenase-like cupin family protein